VLTAFIDRLPGKPLIPLLYPNFGQEDSSAQLFQAQAFHSLTEPLLTVTDDPMKADVLLLPHNFPTVRNEEQYLKKVEALSRSTGKRIIVFWHGDGTNPVPFTNALVFRTSQYRSRLRPNEVIMPAYTEDLLENEPLILKTKEARPVVSFCGWASYPSFMTRILSLAHATLLTVLAVITGHSNFSTRIKGLVLRRRILRILNGCSKIQTDFLLRSSHSAHRKTIRLDPARARDEYINNLLHADLALCVKGDGNYSLRFYEALSLGRIPLLIDTDCALPREDVINYENFMLRIPLKNIRNIDAIIAKFWSTLTPEHFAEMQRLARDTFEKYLSTKKFLEWAIERMMTDATMLDLSQNLPLKA